MNTLDKAYTISPLRNLERIRMQYILMRIYITGLQGDNTQVRGGGLLKILDYENAHYQNKTKYFMQKKVYAAPPF